MAVGRSRRVVRERAYWRFPIEVTLNSKGPIAGALFVKPRAYLETPANERAGSLPEHERGAASRRVVLQRAGIVQARRTPAASRLAGQVVAVHASGARPRAHTQTVSLVAVERVFSSKPDRVRGGRNRDFRSPSAVPARHRLPLCGTSIAAPLLCGTAAGCCGEEGCTRLELAARPLSNAASVATERMNTAARSKAYATAGKSTADATAAKTPVGTRPPPMLNSHMSVLSCPAHVRSRPSLARTGGATYPSDAPATGRWPRRTSAPLSPWDRGGSLPLCSLPAYSSAGHPWPPSSVVSSIV